MRAEQSAQLPSVREPFLPVLRVLADESPLRAREVTSRVADRLGLNDAQRATTISSGQRRFDNRATWAMSYLFHAAAVQRPQTGLYAINERGRGLIAQYPSGIAARDLMQFEEYRASIGRNRQHVAARVSGGSSSTEPTGGAQATDDVEESAPPLEVAADALARLDAEVEADLLQRLHDREPEFLEKAVLKVLHAMGYGGTEGDVQHMGGPGDGGFDGVINQDALGIERVYVQAKRYALDATVGRPEVQGFLGALHAAGAAGGVFITTGRFTTNARDFAQRITPRVILVDGARLARLMLTHGVGVQEAQVFRVVDVDEDFFE